MESLRAQLLVTPHQRTRAYRLIDAFHQPHPHLDGIYDSIDEAFGDAVGWLDGRQSDGNLATIGLEVCTGTGDWRTIRKPVQLLCPLPLPT